MITMIDIDELDQLLPQKDIIIVDLRDADAYRKYHIKGAKNYPYEEMDLWEKEILTYNRILLYCERGSESLMAARKMNRTTNEVYTLIGGIRAVSDFETRNSIDRRNRNR